MRNRRLNSHKATRLLVALCAWLGSRALAQEFAAMTLAASPETAVDEQERKLVAITAEYQMAVAPLIQRACADCHSGDTQYPWYSMMPGISQWIKSDIEEARRHIEFSNGYPFQSHATPLEDLIAVEKTVKGGSMPPLRYRLMHRKARLSDEEKQKIIDWARRGQQMLRDDVARAAEGRP